jgi:hypothetical protein
MILQLQEQIWDIVKTCSSFGLITDLSRRIILNLALRTSHGIYATETPLKKVLDTFLLTF